MSTRITGIIGRTSWFTTPSETISTAGRKPNKAVFALEGVWDLREGIAHEWMCICYQITRKHSREDGFERRAMGRHGRESSYESRVRDSKRNRLSVPRRREKLNAGQ